jgi:hypothetical protein
VGLQAGFDAVIRASTAYLKDFVNRAIGLVPIIKFVEELRSDQPASNSIH